MLKLAEHGQNIREIWIKPDEMILQAGKGRLLLDKKQKFREFLNCRRKMKLRQYIMDIHDVHTHHHDDGM